VLALAVAALLTPALPAPLGGHYAGPSSAGHRVRVWVSSLHHYVGPRDVGPIHVTCADPANPPRDEPSHSVFHFHFGPLRRFSGSGFFTSGNAFTITGHFTSTKRLVGTVKLTTRDDCFGSVSFAARRLPR
jgi:hypothetical protein